LKGAKDLIRGRVLHVRTDGETGSRIKSLSRILLFHAVKDAPLRRHDKFHRSGFLRVPAHALRRGHAIGQRGQFGCTLGVNQELRIGVQGLHFCNILRQDPRVRGAEPLPGDQFPGRLRCHVRREIAVGDKDDLLFVLQNFLHHAYGIGRCAAEVAFRLDRCGCVDIAERCRAGMLRFKLPDVLRRDHVRHGAAGLLIRKQDRFGRGEDLCRLRHEMHAAEYDHIGFRLCRLNAETQGVANVVGDVLNLRKLVIVSQDHGVPFLFPLFNIFSDLHAKPHR